MESKNIRGLQIFPFDEDQQFEQFIEDLFNSLYSTQSFSHFGTGGQSQNGIDIFSIEHKIAIQCKLKDVTSSNQSTIKKRLIKDFVNDFDEFSKYNLSTGNKFSKYIFTSTFKDDVDISKLCIEKSDENLIVEYWGWSKIKNSIPRLILEKHFNAFIELYDKFYKDNDPIILIENISEKEYLQILEQPILDFKNNNVFESIYNLFNNIIFNELSFIPPHIFTKYFLKIYSEEIYYDDFKLTIKDDKIRIFFNSFQIENQNKIISETNIETEKLEFILQKFTNNLFFYITTNNQQIDIRFNKHSECDCVRCKYENYDFVNINFQIEESEENDLDKLILKAYINYKVGNYDTSLLISKH